MKTLIKSIPSVILVFFLTIMLVACTPKTPEKKDTYDESHYGLRYNYTYKENKSYEDAKALLDTALKALKETKSYSYSQQLKGSFDDDVEYTGLTKINVTDKVEASVELVGNLEFAMYVKENNAYINNNGKKYRIEFESDGSNLDSLTSSVIGSLPSMFTFTKETFKKAGTDEHDVNIIEFTTEDGVGTVNLVIYKDKLQKVLYYDDNEITYVANYKYEAVTVTFPNDLDDYEQR